MRQQVVIHFGLQAILFGNGTKRHIASAWIIFKTSTAQTTSVQHRGTDDGRLSFPLSKVEARMPLLLNLTAAAQSVHLVIISHRIRVGP